MVCSSAASRAVFGIAGDRAELGLERLQTALQRGDDQLEAVAHGGNRGQRQATAFGLQRFDHLAAARGQCAQPIIAGHAAAPAAPAQLVRYKGEDQPGIDRVRLGLDAAAWRKAMTSLGCTRMNGMLRSRKAAISIRSWPPVGSKAASPGLTRSSQAPAASLSLAIRSTRRCRQHRHRASPWTHRSPQSACMRARAPSTVRVSDRDADGSEMATVVQTHPRPECPPASPISPIGSPQCNLRL